MQVNTTENTQVDQLINELNKQGLDFATPTGIEAMVARVFAGEASLKDELKISDEALEAIYFLGYTKYKNRRYQDAIDIFSLIVTMDPFHYNGLFGLASSNQMIKAYEAAVYYYFMAAPFAGGNPAPRFHAAESLLALQEKQIAVETFESVIKETKDKQLYKAYIERAETILANIKK
ncbi:MAG: hypothetical protein ACRCV3_00640 [Desulfovibrionaceae bacterium]